MGNSLTSCLSACFVLSFVFASCDQKPEYYAHTFTSEERVRIADEMAHRHYQGSPEEQMTYRYGLALDSTNADLHRERGIAWAKRGLKSQWRGYDDAARLAPEYWLGYRAYMHLYFNRDYKRAIQDCDVLDALTPGFTDYPQSTSVHFIRGVANMQLGNYQKGLDWFNLWLEEETANIELKYLGPPVWQFRAVCLDGLGRPEEAEQSLRKGYEVCSGESTELAYYIGRRHEARGEKQKAAEYYQNALTQLKKGYSFDRPYVEEFWEVEKEEIEDRIVGLE